MNEQKGPEERKITFGPIPSRRLGRSLGIDIVPLKTCTYNCVYCQLGPTLKTTVERKPFYSKETVLKAIDEALSDNPGGVDMLTFSGSGEPTLNSEIGGIIRGIKSTFSVPVAVLTNGSLLDRPDVQEDLAPADIVLPSMDGWTEDIFKKINRPNSSLKLDNILRGLESFRKMAQGEIWLEVLFIRGINDSESDRPGLLSMVERIDPDRIQINTVARPPSAKWALPAKWENLEAIKEALGPKAEIVVPYRKVAEKHITDRIEERTVEMVLRRPVCAEDLVESFGLGIDEAKNVLETLSERYDWVAETHGDRVYVRLPVSEDTEAPPE